jgi:methylated-DNA-[protein]-cysteine S-methyltransferase
MKNRSSENMRETPRQTAGTWYYKTIASPVGTLTLVATDKGLAAILWENDDPKRVRLGPLVEHTTHPLLRRAEAQLGEYFQGKRRTFSVEFDPAGTRFQKDVWNALAKIPYGETQTYGQIARQLGHPKAVRAVGAANGRNPISIMVPCHRVIGASGSLTGFAGGLEAKAHLLTLERNQADRPKKWIR